MSKWKTGNPPRSRSYLVTISVGGGRFVTIKFWSGCMWQGELKGEKSNIVAWMELPEAYEGEKAE